MLCLSVVHQLPKIEYGGAKTGSMQAVYFVICGSHDISTSTAYSNKIPTAVPMFSRSSS